MTTAFNLASLIQAHNKKNKSAISPNETWGLFYLQKNLLEFLNQHADISITRERFANGNLIAQLAQNKYQRQSETHISDESQQKSFAHLTQQLTQELSVRERVKWEANLRKNLNRLFRIFPTPFFQNVDTSSIERDAQLSSSQIITLPFSQHSDSHVKFLELQNLWHKHEAFLSFSNQSLCTFYYFLLLLIEHFRLALAEIEEQEQSFFVFNRMPKAIAQEYKQFLGRAISDFQAARDATIDTMFVRLKVAEATELKSSDVSFYIAGSLDTLHLLPESETFSSYLPDKSVEPIDFKKEDWCDLQCAIAQSISPQHQKKLSESCWFDGQKGSLVTSTKIFEEERLIIPQILEEEMPLWRGWPEWLFADRHTRVDFIKAHQFDFARAKLTSIHGSVGIPTEILETQNYEVLLAQLKKFSSQHLSLNEQLFAEKQSHQQKPLTWWQFGTKRMQVLWQNELDVRVQKNQRYFLAWCEELNQQINELSEDSSFNVVSFMSCWQQILEQSHFILQGASESEALRFTSIKNQMAKRLYSVPLLEAGNLLQTLAKGKSITQHDMTFIKNCVVQMQTLDKGRAESERIAPSFCRTYVNSAIDNVLSQIEKSLLAIRKSDVANVGRVSSQEKSSSHIASQADLSEAFNKPLDSHIPIIRGVYVLPPIPAPKKPLPKKSLQKEPLPVRPFWPSPAEAERLFIKLDLVKMLGSPIHETQLNNLLKDLLIRQSEFFAQTDERTANPFITFLATLIHQYANGELQKQWESLMSQLDKKPTAPNPATRWKTFQNHYAALSEKLVCESIDIQSEITISQLLDSCKEMLDTLAEKDEGVLFHDISTRLQNAGKTHLSELSLKPHEKVLTGVEEKEIEKESVDRSSDNPVFLEHQKRKQVREAIELSAQLHFFRSEIKASQTAAEKKTHVKAIENVISEKMPERLYLFQF